MASQMREGARVSGVLSPVGNQSIPVEKLKTYKQFFDEQMAGSTKHGRIVMTNYGFKLDPFSMPNTDMQLLESRKFSAEDICRFCGVPPHKAMLMDRATFSNIEHQSIEFNVDTIVPWATRFEQQADRKLLTSRRQYHTKMNTNALVRGDMASRGAFYNQLFNLGSISPNEIRGLEEMNPVDGGDQHFRPLNMAPLDEPFEQPQTEPVDDDTELVGAAEEDTELE